MNKKNFSLILLFFCFLTGMVQAQQSDDKRMKIEITVKDGNKTVSGLIRTATFSYSKPADADAKDKYPTKNFYFSLDFEKMNIALLQAFTKNKNGIDGVITMTDTYGKSPARKLEFTKATLESMSDQLAADYSSAYFTIGSDTLIIDGVNVQ
ncbi:hypothetical protein [Flavobacterium hercynium]|uniref:Uncharacterized protein n=1 Tax=Flavobacterium hercynium TaxID=387094 RepID=A0A226GMB9_9FLAO|nr:hypothetical protein [Flavobacterium hercynium]OXA83182.1 hypothetical protein B0A66_22510 [Flavobacterium hercynium]SMP37258.1 hypothetical protein SAMN06265346_1297 [Flavobacterium hercynium]